MLRTGLALVVLAAVAVGSTSCFTSPLPIPPPITEALTGPDADGYVTVTVLAANVEPGAEYLFVYNQQATDADPAFVGDGPQPSGDFVVRIRANRGDCLIAYWMFDSELGLGTTCLPWP